MVRWSAPARDDLKQIHDYISKDSKYYARKVIQEIIAKTEKLIKHPEIGRIVPEVSNQNIRELSFIHTGLFMRSQKAGAISKSLL